MISVCYSFHIGACRNIPRFAKLSQINDGHCRDRFKAHVTLHGAAVSSVGWKRWNRSNRGRGIDSARAQQSAGAQYRLILYWSLLQFFQCRSFIIGGATFFRSHETERVRSPVHVHHSALHADWRLPLQIDEKSGLSNFDICRDTKNFIKLTTFIEFDHLHRYTLDTTPCVKSIRTYYLRLTRVIDWKLLITKGMPAL